MIQTIVQYTTEHKARMAKRTRTHEHVHMNTIGGEGVAYDDDRNTDIHKPAPQKMPKGGLRPTIVELW
jgi:hypothetical protein